MICSSRKIMYESRREAVAFTKRSKVGAGNKGRRPYLCNECQHWHLGHKMPKHVQRARRRWLEGHFEDERRRGNDAA